MLKKELYPFKSNYLDIDGNKMHYLDEGQGEAVLMVHGNPTWSFYYRNLVKALSKNYRCIVPDHIGMGLSDRPGDDRYEYTSTRRGEDLERLVEHLKIDRFVLIGHDWGGILGTALATDHPEKVMGMVLMNTQGFLWPAAKKLPAALFTARIPYVSPFFIRKLNLFARIAILMYGKAMSKDVAAGLIHPYNSWKNNLAIHRFIQDIPVRPGDVGWERGARMEARLKLLKDVPKVFFWGLKDFIFCEIIMKEWMRYFPDAELHKFEDAGHYILEDKADS